MTSLACSINLSVKNSDLYIPSKPKNLKKKKMNNGDVNKIFLKTETFKAGQTYRSYLSKTLKAKTPKLNPPFRQLRIGIQVQV